jgi:hypothetical protein
MHFNASSTKLVIMSLQLDVGTSCPTFVHLRQYTGDFEHIRALRGEMVGFALYQPISLPSILNWKTGQVVNLSSQPCIHVGCHASHATLK